MSKHPATSSSFAGICRPTSLRPSKLPPRLKKSPRSSCHMPSGLRVSRSFLVQGKIVVEFSETAATCHSITELGACWAHNRQCGLVQRCTPHTLSSATRCNPTRSHEFAALAIAHTNQHEDARRRVAAASAQSSTVCTVNYSGYQILMQAALFELRIVRSPARSVTEGFEGTNDALSKAGAAAKEKSIPYCRGA